jgi:hypothetical protein
MDMTRSCHHFRYNPNRTSVLNSGWQKSGEFRRTISANRPWVQSFRLGQQGIRTREGCLFNAAYLAPSLKSTYTT